MKNIFIILAFMLGAICSEASVVSTQDAQTVAANYFKLKRQVKLADATLTYTQTEPDGSADYYVFDITPGTGFVIVSAIDNVQPILAYSYETHFKADANHLTGVSDWMNERASTIAKIAKSNLQANDNVKSQWAAYIVGNDMPQLRSSGIDTFLLTTTWNQGGFAIGGTGPPYAYDYYCPDSGGFRCYTGCVATGMGQIMKFWNYPVSGTSSNSYSTQYGTLSANFSSFNYLWSDMPNSLNSNSTSAQIDAVAGLLSICGIAVNMDYGYFNGSGAYGTDADGGQSAQNALTTYFGYDGSTIQSITPNSDTAAWITQLENELDAGRPFLYEARTATDGHFWVCDGYNSSNLFHMNWGWGGDDNGYYNVNGLVPTPDPNGVFNNSYRVLIGVEPPCNGSLGLGTGNISSANGVQPFLSSGTITSANTFSSGQNYGLVAAHLVNLTPGFHYVPSGSYDFAASISNCGSPLLPQSVEYSSNQVNGISTPNTTDGINIFPNPFSSSFDLAVNVDQNAEASVTVYTLLGAAVKQIPQWQLAAGNNMISIDMGNLASGLYMVEINYGETNVVRKVVKN